MLIHTISDLHLEFGSPPVLPGGDVLLVCGDTVVASHIGLKNRSNEAAEINKLYRKFLREQVARKYSHALFLLGNHEHYGCALEDTAGIVRNLLADTAPCARLLDDEVAVIDGVGFVGSTLWAPCKDARMPDAENVIQQSMNDFMWIKTKAAYADSQSLQMNYLALQWGRQITTLDVRRKHQKSLKWLRAEVKKHTRCFVLTHHAPSYRSTTKYYNDKLTPAYCSRQDRWIRGSNIICWAHGHTHTNADYEIGATRVISNQRGYFGRERIAAEFDPSRCAIEIR